MLPDSSHCVVTSIQALYLHVPFCHTICPFCAFAVHGNRTALHRPYLDALRDEIALRGKTHGTPASAVRAVYIGGGTPSTLALDDVAHMLQSLRRNFKLAPDAEIAFEVNPEDALPEYLDGLLALGINRISLGLQSFDGATLAALGRGHDAGQSRAAAEAPICRGSEWSPGPGMMPRFDSKSPTYASVDMMRMSQSSARSSPPPTAMPLIAAMKGFGLLEKGCRITLPSNFTPLTR